MILIEIADQRMIARNPNLFAGRVATLETRGFAIVCDGFFKNHHSYFFKKFELLACGSRGLRGFSRAYVYRNRVRDFELKTYLYVYGKTLETLADIK